MEIKFHSPVIMTEDFELMESFYQNILQQQIEFDFGNCIGFKNGLSLWKLKDEYYLDEEISAVLQVLSNLDNLFTSGKILPFAGTLQP